ncbi:MAG: A/G-specific adenine glycosylase [Desulfovermiculus sp.]
MSDTSFLSAHISSTISSKLLAWFSQSCRDLPWRQNPTPYRVWISEVMLQQTQVDRVVPYFLHWMEIFPHIQAVAEADQERVLKAWEGLGYYTRAKNIQAAAQKIWVECNGVLPSDMSLLRALPGIGPYTAAAIASLAFNQPVPAVDANVQRVMARILNEDGPIKSALPQKTIRKAVTGLISDGDPRSMNQALMELGALVCTPRSPACASCPVKEQCQSLAAEVVHLRPVMPDQKPSIALQVAAGVLLDNERILIQKRPPHGLMANLWEFPGGKLQAGESPEQALVREFREELELEIRVLDKITVIKHSYTRFRVTLHVYWCTLASPGQELVLHAASDFRWTLPEELDQYPFPAADCKLIQMLSEKVSPEVATAKHS